MIHWQNTLVSPSDTVKDAMQVLDRSTVQIVLVVDEERRLLGAVTDGDVRRSILAGIPVEAPVHKIMNRNPRFCSVNDSREVVLSLMKAAKLHQIPLLDKNRRVQGLEVIDDLFYNGVRDNWVILMAGGYGSRLRPYTDSLPKPLVEVGQTPILEIIIRELQKYGLSKFIITLHYKQEMIREYFGDGSRWNVRIEYVQEKEKLGTAGALGLLPEIGSSPLLVMNSDLLTNVNFSLLLDYHSEHDAAATMCVREYTVQVPFGVASLDNNRLVSLEEKPEQKFFVNAGIYILENSVLEYISPNQKMDMNELLDFLLKKNQRVNVFPIREYWLDVGREFDLEKANREFPEHFSQE